VLTTLMMGYVMFRIWRVRPIWAVPVYAVLFCFDLALFAASSTKIPDGAWLPLAIAAAVMVVLSTWSKGIRLLGAALTRDGMKLADLPAAVAGVVRVPGLGVYLSRGAVGVPIPLRKSISIYHALPERILLVSIQTALRPRLAPGARMQFREIAPGIGHASLTFGFFEEPNVPAALASLPPPWNAAPETVSYFLGRQNVMPAERSGMARWRTGLFGAMVRLSGSATAPYFRLPAERVIELGNEIAI